MSSDALLAATVDGDSLELSATGDWTSDRANDLERLVMAAAIPPQSPIRSVRVNMAGVASLDNYGAWLLQQLLRGSRERGATADLINLPARFRVVVDTAQRADARPIVAQLRRRGITERFAAAHGTITAPVRILAQRASPHLPWDADRLWQAALPAERFPRLGGYFKSRGTAPSSGRTDQVQAYAPIPREETGTRRRPSPAPKPMSKASSDSLLAASLHGDTLDLLAAGDWTADRANDLERLVMAAEIPQQSPVRFVRVHMADVAKLDTYGAWLLERLLRGSRERGAAAEVIGLPDQFRVIVDTVHQTTELPDPERLRRKSVTDWLANVGENIAEVGRSAGLFAQMLGAVTFSALRVFVKPRTFRFTSMVNQVDLVGWRAVPIILLITFLIGAILAQQGIFHFRKFGADVFVVDMVGILVLREVGVLIVCVMVAGRSGSAYTAELGSMKMREEIDALQTMGFDPISVLVLPRILALVIAVPMLTFLGEMSAIYGAGLVASLYGGIQPEVFIQRLREVISLDHFMVGMIKAPFMALVIGIVACVRGLETKGSAESLGMQTTNAVVQSIFLVIVLDGIFAVFFAAIDK